MTLQRLEVFSAVARLLNLSHAAREFHVTPSAASHAVKQLERDLGIKLIRQTHHGVELTDGGASAKKDVEAILSMIKQLKKKYRS